MPFTRAEMPSKCRSAIPQVAPHGEIAQVRILPGARREGAQKAMRSTVRAAKWRPPKFSHATRSKKGQTITMARALFERQKALCASCLALAVVFCACISTGGHGVAYGAAEAGRRGPVITVGSFDFPGAALLA